MGTEIGHDLVTWQLSIALDTFIHSSVIHLTTENVEAKTLSHFGDHWDNVRACHSWNLWCSCDQLITPEIFMKAYKNIYKNFHFLKNFGSESAHPLVHYSLILKLYWYVNVCSFKIEYISDNFSVCSVKKLFQNRKEHSENHFAKTWKLHTQIRYLKNLAAFECKLQNNLVFTLSCNGPVLCHLGTCCYMSAARFSLCSGSIPYRRHGYKKVFRGGHGWVCQYFDVVGVLHCLFTDNSAFYSLCVLIMTMTPLKVCCGVQSNQIIMTLFYVTTHL